ncbi:AraC family transcriptional regulator [Paenibacillus apiarius]|uniref:helix-turn-helix transcriptional regulator n=1 Tax=Paenibacillus apiarius TaxID=46240 RepID=UPI003B3ABD19
MPLIPTPILSLDYRTTKPIHSSFHTHFGYEVYMFHSGRCEYLLGQAQLQLVPGDIIIMNGMARHGPIPDRREAYVRTTMLFDPCEAEAWCKPLCDFDVLQPFRALRNKHLRLQDEQRAEAEELLFRLHRFYEVEGKVAQIRLRTALLDLFLFLYEQCESTFGTGQQDSSKPIVWAERIVEYVETHLHEDDLSLDDMEARLHASKYHLIKSFKQVTGLTIFEYVTRRRISQAKMLLLSFPDVTVTQIGLQAGFKDASHFSRTFKSLVGMTPNEYRRKAKI